MDGEDCSGEVREWCIGHGGDKYIRIALCGFNEDHDELLAHGWRKVQGKAGGSGYNKNKSSHKRERIWLSPWCIESQLEFLTETP